MVKRIFNKIWSGIFCFFWSILIVLHWFFRLSLFLDIFRIKSCILNSQMPANYRCQIIHEFNEGKYPYIIASESNEIFDESEELDEQKVYKLKLFEKEKFVY